MNVKDIVKIDPKIIRKNNELMRLYIELYEDAFSVKPNCAGCTFSKDFNKLKKFASNQNTEIHYIKKTKIMNNFKLKRKHNGDILTYKKDRRPYRTYGRIITDEFASEFLTHGTKSEIERRKEMFDIIPEVEVENPEPEVLDLSKMSRTKLNKVAKDLDIDPKNHVNKKSLLSAIIEKQQE